MTEKEKILYLRNKYGAGIMNCIKFIRENPNADLDCKETKLQLGYKEWLSHFLDGDRTYEGYLKKIGEK